MNEMQKPTQCTDGQPNKNVYFTVLQFQLYFL